MSDESRDIQIPWKSAAYLGIGGTFLLAFPELADQFITGNAIEFIKLVRSSAFAAVPWGVLLVMAYNIHVADKQQKAKRDYQEEARLLNEARSNYEQALRQANDFNQRFTDMNNKMNEVKKNIDSQIEDIAKSIADRVKEQL